MALFVFLLLRFEFRCAFSAAVVHLLLLPPCLHALGASGSVPSAGFNGAACAAADGNIETTWDGKSSNDVCVPQSTLSSNNTAPLVGFTLCSILFCSL